MPAFEQAQSAVPLVEIIGEPDLNSALGWARKAYEVYKTPYALSYVNILEQRQANDAVLRSQTDTTSN